MAIICNGRIGIYANELIIENPSRKIGSKHGFLPEGTYQTMVRKKAAFPITKWFACQAGNHRLRYDEG